MYTCQWSSNTAMVLKFWFSSDSCWIGHTHYSGYCDDADTYEPSVHTGVWQELNIDREII